MTALVAALTLAGLGALAACTGTRTGSGGEKPPEQYAPVQEVTALRAPMAEAVGALVDVKRLAAMGGAAERQQAYQRFATAFGQVLGPLSFQDAAAAQRMANANTALEEALSRQTPDRAAVAAEADVIVRTVNETAARLGTPLMATATAQVGADQAAPPVPTGAGPGTTPAAAGGGPATVPAAKAPRVIEVIARNYRFEPARIEVRKGEPITIRLRNMGTEKHEWELEAFHVEIRPIDPGKTGQVTFTPDRTGTFQYVCEVDGHKQKGMVGFLIVK
jgi:uncharacterized cupredoxin-like copper-binding protein